MYYNFKKNHKEMTAQPAQAQPRAKYTEAQMIADWIASKKIQFDTVGIERTRDGVPMSDLDDNSLYLDCLNELFNGNRKAMPKDFFNTILDSNYIPQNNPIKVFRESISIPNDTEMGFVDKLISGIPITGTDEDVAITRDFIKRWLVGIVATMSGDESPLMLVLCGGVGTGKTRFFRDLLPKTLQKYRRETRLEDKNQKDELTLFARSILVLLDDFDVALRDKKKSAFIRELLSKDKFDIRLPYGKQATTMRRLGVMCGTSNEYEILLNDNLNRRFVPVRLSGALNFDILNSVDRDLLFAELYRLYWDGHPFKILGNDIAKLEAIGKQFLTPDTTREILEDNFEEQPDGFGEEWSVTQIIAHLGGRYRLTPDDTTVIRFGMAIKALGWKKTRKRSGMVYRLTRRES